MQKNKKYYNFWYKYLWEIFYWFSCFIIEEALKNDVNNILFSARDWLNFLNLVKVICECKNIRLNLKPLYISRTSLKNFLDWKNNNIDKYLKNILEEKNIIIDIWYNWTSHFFLKDIIKKLGLKTEIKSIFLLKYNKEYLKKNSIEDDKENLIWFFNDDYIDELKCRALKRNSWWIEVILWDYSIWSNCWFDKLLNPMFLEEKASKEQIEEVNSIYEWIKDYIIFALENNIQVKNKKILFNKMYKIFCFPSQYILNLFKNFSFSSTTWESDKYNSQLKVFNNYDNSKILKEKDVNKKYDIWHRNPWIWWKMSFDKILLEEKKDYYKKIFNEEIVVVWWINWEDDIEKLYYLCK